MLQDIKMPKHGLNMTKGLVAEFSVQPGDSVKKGDILFIVETDKATLEVESEFDGVVEDFAAEEGEEVPVGTIVLTLQIEAPQEAPPAAAAPAEPGAVKAAKVQATPAARKLAMESGVNLADVKAAGQVVERGDVERHLQAAAAPAKAAPPPFIYDTTGKEKAPRGTVKRLTGERLAYSFREIPHFSLCRTVELAALNADRAARAKDGVKLSLNDYLCAAVAKALAEHPLANASFFEDEIWLNPAVNVGYATATPKGLMVPVVRTADKLTLAQLAEKRRDVVQKAVDGKIAPEELDGGTFTITNLGTFGVDSFSAVINPPQAAILAVGRAATRLVLSGGKAAEMPVVQLTLSVDHRVLDGSEAAVFFASVVQNLLEPENL